MHFSLAIRASCLSVILALSGAAVAEEGKKQKQVKLDVEVVIKVPMNHLLYLPDGYEEKDSWPLLIFLHGVGERGDDLEKVKLHGPPKLIEAGKKFPFVVISPQCRRRGWWQPEAVAQLVETAVKTHKIDRRRVYLTGLSMGGYGTWATATKFSHLFAAVVPICGGGEPADAARMKAVPTWAFHGAKDRVVPLKQSEDMVSALETAGGNVKLTTYPDADHDSWTVTYENDKVYEWLLKHQLPEKEPSPKE